MIQKLGVKAPSPKSHRPIVQYKIPENDLPQFDFRLRQIDSIESLEELTTSQSPAGDWNRLTETAVHQNPFFDPDFLVPAFRHLKQNADVSVLVVDAPNRKHPAGPRVLCALLPVIKRRFYGLPLSCYEVWKHEQCFDCTPLIRQDCGREAVSFLFDQLGQKTSMFSLDMVSGEGEFQKILTDVLYQQIRSIFFRNAFTRACMLPLENAEAYIRTHVSKNTRKNATRMEQKLKQLGNFQWSVSANTTEAESWIDEFLELEASGWKGKSQTALNSQSATRGFFKEMASRTLKNEKMSFLRMDLNGKLISMLCDIHQGNRGIAYKTAFDESYFEYSPGVIAELKNIERLHDASTVCMDSCATPDHSMINRVWPNRIRMQSFVVALGGSFSKLSVSAMPFLQTLAGFFKRSKAQ